MTKEETLHYLMKNEVNFNLDVQKLSSEEVVAETKRLSKIMELMDEVIHEKEGSLAQLKQNVADLKASAAPSPEK